MGINLSSTNNRTKPWRKTSSTWTKEFEKSLLAKTEEIASNEKDTNLLLIGPVSSGKSAFINSILSVIEKRKVDIAPTQAGSKSCTRSYDKYTKDSLLKNYSLRDCMGIEQNDGDGLHIKDVVALLMGHIKDGYKFNPLSPITEDNEYYRKDPKFENEIHCVVFVVDSNSLANNISNAYLKKIREMQNEVRRLRIPRVLVLTKADLLCQDVDNDNTMMFRSRRIQQVVKKASEVFNIPEASIHPVTNYEKRSFNTWKMNIPLLIALIQIMQYAADRIEHHETCNDSD